VVHDDQRNYLTTQRQRSSSIRRVALAKLSVSSRIYSFSTAYNFRSIPKAFAAKTRSDTSARSFTSTCQVWYDISALLFRIRRHVGAKLVLI